MYFFAKVVSQHPWMDIINGFDEIPLRASPSPLIRSMPYIHAHFSWSKSTSWYESAVAEENWPDRTEWTLLIFPNVLFSDQKNICQNILIYLVM